MHGPRNKINNAVLFSITCPTAVTFIFFFISFSDEILLFYKEFLQRLLLGKPSCKHNAVIRPILYKTEHQEPTKGT
jgi:hypothetical protein